MWGGNTNTLNRRHQRRYRHVERVGVAYEFINSWLRGVGRMLGQREKNSRIQAAYLKIMRLRLPPLPDKNGIQISILIIPAEGTRPTNVKILSSLVESLSMCAIRWWYITFQWTNSDLLLSPYIGESNCNQLSSLSPTA